MIILGIETSCDETAAAVLTNDQKRITILSNVVASSANLQAKYGGVIPEQAAREQIKSIIPVIEAALNESRITSNDINAIAVTQGPGLIGSLLVGVETAKALATVWNKPLVPINHLIGHFYANWITNHLPGVPQAEHHLEGVIPTFPCIGLLISGGHTDLVLFRDHGKYKYLGGTRDDASGECFDKCARLLNLPYPGGPEISKLASQGNALRFNLPRPMIDSKDFDFSFSGLKTAVANLLKNEGALSLNAANSRRAKRAYPRRKPQDAASEAGVVSEQVSGIADRNILQDLSASIEQAIVDVLVTKTLTAAQKYPVKEIIVAGGVAANQKLVNNLQFTIYNLQLKTKLHVPPPELCTDNAAMIASAAFFNYHPIDPLKLQADPNLALST